MVEGRPDWCTIHNCAMQYKEGQYGGWYSHETTDPRYPQKQDGRRWCKGKLPQQQPTGPPQPHGGAAGGPPPDVWKLRHCRAHAPAIFFSDLTEWENYMMYGQKPGVHNEPADQRVEGWEEPASWSQPEQPEEGIPF